MMFDDPGPCGICGAPHTACTAQSGAVSVAQLPATAARVSAAPEPPPAAAPLVCETVQATLPPGSFTSGTYRGRRQKAR